ncbi:MAG: hypothetical protein ACUVXH_00715, partial [Anaerolineae bacterium]
MARERGIVFGSVRVVDSVHTEANVDPGKEERKGRNKSALRGGTTSLTPRFSTPSTKAKKLPDQVRDAVPT